MRCVIQKVTEASVNVNGETVGAIGTGYMVLIGVSVDDTEADVRYMAEKGYVVQATTRQFDPKRDYLWPIPAADRLINENLTQNPGY